MSIAASILLQPPRSVIAAMRIISGGFFFIAIVVWFGFDVEIALLQKIATTGACIFASFLSGYYSRRLENYFYINISSRGNIALGLARLNPHSMNSASNVSSLTAKLLTGTTIWSHLIILRLLLDNNRTIFIPVTKGTCNERNFRTLAVACKWILRHNDPAQGAKS